jgi:hypothetical protein
MNTIVCMSCLLPCTCVMRSLIEVTCVIYIYNHMYDMALEEQPR